MMEADLIKRAIDAVESGDETAALGILKEWLVALLDTMERQLDDPPA